MQYKKLLMLIKEKIVLESGIAYQRRKIREINKKIEEMVWEKKVDK